MNKFNYGGNNNCITATTARTSVREKFSGSTIVDGLSNVSGKLYSNFCTVGGDVLANFGNVGAGVVRANCNVRRTVGTSAITGVRGAGTLRSRLTGYYYRAERTVRNMGCGVTAGAYTLRGAVGAGAESVVRDRGTKAETVLSCLYGRGVSSLRTRGGSLHETTSRSHRDTLLAARVTTRARRVVGTIGPTPVPTCAIPSPCKCTYKYGANYKYWGRGEVEMAWPEFVRNCIYFDDFAMVENELLFTPGFSLKNGLGNEVCDHF